jgi:tetratricopeptide (TPR) repeat protein
MAVLAGRSEARQAAAAPDPRLESVPKLEEEVAVLRRRLDALEKSRAEGRDSEPGKAGVAASGKDESKPAADAVASKAGPGDGSDLTAAIAEVVAAGFSQEAIAAFIERIRKEKGHAAAQAALEALLERDPRNAKAHYLLARAYVDELMISKSYADMERLGKLCMAEYGSALEIDPAYWEPRFERAISLTYYPEQMGMLPDAVRDFETLVKQQNRSNADPRFAETYANLARVYVRTGKRDKAVATLNDAVALFPDSESLKKQLEEMEE